MQVWLVPAFLHRLLGNQATVTNTDTNEVRVYNIQFKKANACIHYKARLNDYVQICLKSFPVGYGIDDLNNVSFCLFVPHHITMQRGNKLNFFFNNLFPLEFD